MTSGYYRFPTIQADTVVFVCEDDLWSVPASGGIARRLTSDVGEVTRPLLSPDGELLAYAGREEGHSELYVMPAVGGPAQRLTFMGSSLCQPVAWTAERQVLFASNAEHWYHRFTYLYSLPAVSETQGVLPRRLDYGPARSIAFGPQGGVLLGRNTEDPARWKRYRGGTTGHFWIDLEGRGEFQPFLKLPGNLTSPMWLPQPGEPAGRIYFISDHEGIGNLYSCRPSGEDVRRHTDHEEYYARNATSDGKRIVYHAGADLYLYDPASAEDRRIEVGFHSPQTQRKRRFADPQRYLESWALHPNGYATAITTRGRLFSFANWEGAVIQHGKENCTYGDDSTPTGIRYRLPAWLNDGERLVAVSDEGGEEAFVILSAEGGEELERLADLDIGRPEDMRVNPRQDRVAFSNHRLELMVLDLKTQELRLIDRGKVNHISGFDWSPDGEWLVYSVSLTLHTTALKLWQAATGESFEITRPVLRDVLPAFDPQGKYIYFISYRLFDPVPDNLHFELSFPRGMKPFLITLQKDTPSPFIPRPRKPQPDKPDRPEESRPEAKQDGGEPEQDKEDKAAQEQPQVKPLQIDLEGIEARVLAFPVHEGLYGRVLGTKDGKVLYTRYPLEGSLEEPDNDSEPGARGTLWLYDFETLREEAQFYEVSDFDLNRLADTLIYRSGKYLRVYKAGEKPPENTHSPGRKSGWLDLERVRVEVLPGAEWRQMFREAWRLQRDQFWTPDMSQIDWVAVHDRYLPLVERVSSRSEFSDLIGEMQGELGTSHAYEFGGDYRPAPSYSLGFLGASFVYDPETEAWRIGEVLRGDPWDPRADSPLNTPGTNVKAGDRLLAVNGKKLGRNLSPMQALVNLAGREVSLVVASGDDEARSVTVKTLPSETQARYRQWVEANRQRVHDATGGRVGYLHIPDMSSAGYAEFHRGYLAEVDRDGLIIDVRFNRGGYVSALLLEKLGRRRLGYDQSRWYQYPIPYPQDSVSGPLLALINEHAGSDGDIFSHGFKLMKLGPLVGKRTWGGVVGIEPRHALVDGTLTTQPEFSAWFSDVGWGLENYGTDPDIEVDIAPQDYARGYDAQLERGIEEMLKLLESNPPQRPGFTPGPSLALPRLPKR
jgi:tricorn protease